MFMAGSLIEYFLRCMPVERITMRQQRDMDKRVDRGLGHDGQNFLNMRGSAVGTQTGGGAAVRTNVGHARGAAYERNLGSGSKIARLRLGRDQHSSRIGSEASAARSMFNGSFGRVGDFIRSMDDSAHLDPTRHQEDHKRHDQRSLNKSLSGLAAPQRIELFEKKTSHAHRCILPYSTSVTARRGVLGVEAL